MSDFAHSTSFELTSSSSTSSLTIDTQVSRLTTGGPKLGILRLDDYDYPPAVGDVDHPDSYEYEVHYRIVPGLTFEMCQKNAMTEEVEAEFLKAIDYLTHDVGVIGITGDCGFMMFFQELAREHSKVPVFMSALVQLPAVTCSFAKHEQIIIVTANGENLEAMHPLIAKETNTEVSDNRFIILGAENVPGFEAVANCE